MLLRCCSLIDDLNVTNAVLLKCTHTNTHTPYIYVSDKMPIIISLIWFGPVCCALTTATARTRQMNESCVAEWQGQHCWLGACMCSLLVGSTFSMARRHRPSSFVGNCVLPLIFIFCWLRVMALCIYTSDLIIINLHVHCIYSVIYYMFVITWKLSLCERKKARKIKHTTWKENGITGDKQRGAKKKRR